MDTKKAIKIINEALNLSTQKGIFNLEDTKFINKALETIDILEKQYNPEPISENEVFDPKLVSENID